MLSASMAVVKTRICLRSESLTSSRPKASPPAALPPAKRASRTPARMMLPSSAPMAGAAISAAPSIMPGTTRARAMIGNPGVRMGVTTTGPGCDVWRAVRWPRCRRERGLATNVTVPMMTAAADTARDTAGVKTAAITAARSGPTVNITSSLTASRLNPRLLCGPCANARPQITRIVAPIGGENAPATTLSASSAGMGIDALTMNRSRAIPWITPRGASTGACPYRSIRRARHGVAMTFATPMTAVTAPAIANDPFSRSRRRTMESPDMARESRPRRLGANERAMWGWLRAFQYEGSAVDTTSPKSLSLASEANAVSSAGIDASKGQAPKNGATRPAQVGA